jgi:hypothetical protein
LADNSELQSIDANAYLFASKGGSFFGSPDSGYLQVVSIVYDFGTSYSITLKNTSNQNVTVYDNADGGNLTLVGPGYTGSTGSTGPTGRTGPTGSTGPTGPIGDGASFPFNSITPSSFQLGGTGTMVATSATSNARYAGVGTIIALSAKYVSGGSFVKTDLGYFLVTSNTQSGSGGSTWTLGITLDPRYNSGPVSISGASITNYFAVIVAAGSTGSTGPAVSAGGSDTQIQYNSNGAFAGSSALTYTYAGSPPTLNIDNINISSLITLGSSLISIYTPTLSAGTNLSASVSGSSFGYTMNLSSLKISWGTISLALVSNGPTSGSITATILSSFFTSIQSITLAIQSSPATSNLLTVSNQTSSTTTFTCIVNQLDTTGSATTPIVVSFLLIGN